MLRKHVNYVIIRSIRNNSTLAKPLMKEKTKQIPLITCKNTQHNFFLNDLNDAMKQRSTKFGKLALASKGWHHRKSRDDHFIIHSTKLESDRVLEDAILPYDQLHLDPVFVDNLKRSCSIMKTSYIQSKAIPVILSGNHTLIAAETGCGKTLAYLLPIMQQILETKSKLNSKNFNTPLALILTPGRELAEQIGSVAEKITEGTDLKVKVILGGRTKQQMLNPSFDDMDILIGTIGATSKLVTTGILRMHEVRHVVLDEADTLLDDSFNEKLAYFLKRFPFHRNHLQNLNEDIIGTQIVLASATMPTNTKELLENIINPDMLVEVVSPNLHRILLNVPQKFYRMNKSDRPAHLITLVKKDLLRKNPVIIFGNKSATSDYISLFLNDNGVNCINLNGDMLHQIRLGRFEKFQTGEVNVLSTTDIGSRGLDTTRAHHVINFDFPLHVADYIHRCGRTGRLGSSSKCRITNFISSLREIELVQRIEHAARTDPVLTNVNGNITNIIKNNMMRDIEEDHQNNLFKKLNS